LVGSVDLLGDHALGVAQPARCFLRGRDDWHQLDRGVRERGCGKQLLQCGASLTERTFEQVLVLVREEVESDIAGRCLPREPLNARGGGVNALAERVEVLATVGAAYDDLAVEHITTRGQAELGKVATKRFTVARLQEDVVSVNEREAAEAVELDL